MHYESKPPIQYQASSSMGKLEYNKEAAEVMEIESNISHLADPFLHPFHKASFDPAEYFNIALPLINFSKSSQPVKGTVPLSELCSIAQTLVSQLNASTARLAATLTRLTDEIIRSGSRLTYEVEILRGNTINVSEALTDTLQEDLANFVSSPVNNLSENEAIISQIPNSQFFIDKDPSFLKDIRTLTLVRSRLEAVIKTFGEAMAWDFPPSEVSTASLFLSVSGPDTACGANGCSIEEKGQQVLQKLRKEVADLLSSDDTIYGIEAAAKRVEELKNLTTVWKGTSEERARINFVQTLAKMVEDRHRNFLREKDQESRLRREPQKVPESGNEIEEGKLHTGYGFISQLQKLRGP